MQARFLSIIIALTMGVVLLVAGAQHANAAPLRIINGADVEEGEQAGVVGILLADVTDMYDAQFCGGTLIADEWVLTAAHCTFDMELSPFSARDLDVVIGSRQLQNGMGERIAVDRIIRHQAFDFNTYYNDIALLHLSVAVEADMVALAIDSDEVDMTIAVGTVMGWGVTEDGYGATSLRQADLPIVSQKSCAAFYAEQGYIVGESMVCAGYKTGGIDACAGDSGGPLMIWDNELDRWTQVGIVSAGAGCAEPGYYGLYTNLTDFADWIEKMMEA